MIKYSLRCAEGHAFDSWFASASAYDALAGAGRLSCAVCGGGGVEKAMMAPRVSSRSAPEMGPQTDRESGRETAAVPAQAAAGGVGKGPAARPLATPASPIEAALAEFRARVEANTEDVGRRFAKEARAIHEGAAPARAIRGQADAAEAKALIEDGVPVLPLPFPGPRQVN